MLFGYGTGVPGGILPGGVEVAACVLGTSVGRGVGWTISVGVAIVSSVGRTTGPVALQAMRASDSKAGIHFLMNDACFGLIGLSKERLVAKREAIQCTIPALYILQAVDPLPLYIVTAN
jgi:hypothetical protein